MFDCVCTSLKVPFLRRAFAIRFGPSFPMGFSQASLVFWKLGIMLSYSYFHWTCKSLFFNACEGPKGFSLSSYGSEASTVEPFLIDEKKITAKHVVFWVEKRLAAQGIIPVWKD